MELRQLRSFVHIAQLGSISLAAERLCIVQPALTRQIQALEVELSARLFVRHGRGVVLTPQGESLLARATSILLEVERARAELKSDSTVLSGEISFGMPPTVADVLSGSLIEKFSNFHPGVKLRVNSAYSGHVLEWLQKGSLDLGVLYEAAQQPMIKSRPLIVESLFLVERSSGKEPNSDAVCFHDVARARLVLPSRQHGLRILIDNVAMRHNVPISTVAETDSLPVQIDLVRRGFGATILPLVSVFAGVAAGEFTARPIVEPEITRRLLLSHAVDRPPQAATQAFAETIVSEVIDLAESGKWPGVIPNSHD
ncbi:hypothetical protein AC629_19275 [Bradyrhizobium sp. NAS80.1]|uniref:LysR substrate-binding domain-containing protein n=1 Tax=Bradyrhizobium sp. NAS80.1 TaxID=1680159 RepID=UPI000969FF61|nr:LysR substrate-binding domain-containing protein [Bradyrhizobium sp. NAS80.1]OKO85363.1 hypothetical protein AC629_19275 [Bradyrhizobium sp. NAS80.1]